MENIKFEQFINNFNFRYFQDWDIHAEIEDTKIIRIYLPSDGFPEGEWFEFGIYDFGGSNQKREILSKILKKEILESYIWHIEHDSNLKKVKVYLTNERYSE